MSVVDHWVEGEDEQEIDQKNIYIFKYIHKYKKLWFNLFKRRLMSLMPYYTLNMQKTWVSGGERKWKWNAYLCTAFCSIRTFFILFDSSFFALHTFWVLSYRSWKKKKEKEIFLFLLLNNVTWLALKNAWRNEYKKEKKGYLSWLFFFCLHIHKVFENQRVSHILLLQPVEET